MKAIKSLLFILFSIVLLTAKDRILLSDDSSFSIVHKGTYAGGTQHGADTLILQAYHSGLGDTLTTFLTATHPLFPYFSTIITVQNGTDYNSSDGSDYISPWVYCAIGWSSGGSGHESFTAWLIRKDHKQIDIIDRVSVIKPRSYPLIGVDTTSNEIAIFRDRSKFNYEKSLLEDDLFYFSLSLGNGSEVNLSGKKGYKNKQVQRFNVTPAHPYARDSIETKEIVAVVKITSSGFKLK